MSTLKTHNLQSPDAGSVNIVMTPNAGMVVTGISTFSNDVLITDKIIHTGDTNTAIRFPSADTFSVETAGSERLRIHSNGDVKIGSGSPALAVGSGLEIDTGSAATIRLEDSSSTSSFEIQNTGSVIKQRMYNNQPWVIEHGSGEKFRITNTGQLLVGTSSASNRFKNGNGNGATPKFQFETANVDEQNDISLTFGRNNAFGAEIILAKHRAATVGGYTVVQSDDRLGGINFAGSDGTHFRPAALIQGRVDGTPGTGDMPGRLEFLTTADGAATPTERLRITSSGHLLPGANNQYDLGSVAKGWRNVYMNDLNLSNMNGDTNDVDGTQGSWTIQEGKDDLYIINRLNGKKFKIKMEEIS